MGHGHDALSLLSRRLVGMAEVLEIFHPAWFRVVSIGRLRLPGLQPRRGLIPDPQEAIEDQPRVRIPLVIRRDQHLLRKRKTYHCAKSIEASAHERERPH